MKKSLLFLFTLFFLVSYPDCFALQRKSRVEASSKKRSGVSLKFTFTGDKKNLSPSLDWYDSDKKEWTRKKISFFNKTETLPSTAEEFFLVIEELNYSPDYKKYYEMNTTIKKPFNKEYSVILGDCPTQPGRCIGDESCELSNFDCMKYGCSSSLCSCDPNLVCDLTLTTSE